MVAASIPFFANAGTYAASAVLVGLVSGTYRAARPGQAPPPDAVDPRARGARRPRGVRAEVAEGLRWLLKQRMLRTMAILIGLLNITLAAATAVLVLLAKERLHVGSVGYLALFTCMAVGSLLGSAVGDRVIRAGYGHLDDPDRAAGRGADAPDPHARDKRVRRGHRDGRVRDPRGARGPSWGMWGGSGGRLLTGSAGSAARTHLRRRFSWSGHNGGALAGAFGITAPYWVGFVVALIVAAATWRVFDRATVAAAYAEPAAAEA